MRRKRFDEINIVPFIDIVLVLLVIVLATATFAQKNSVKIDLPTSSSEEKVERKDITISINKTGDYYYDEVNITLKELETRLNKLDSKKDTISLQTDKESQFQKFVAVIDILKAKKFENLSIVTKE